MQGCFLSRPRTRLVSLASVHYSLATINEKLTTSSTLIDGMSIGHQGLVGDTNR